LPHPSTHPLTNLGAGPQESQKAVGALPLLLELAGCPLPEAALAAAHCLLKLALLHPVDAASVLATPECVGLLTTLLDPAAAAAAAAEHQALGSGSNGGGGFHPELAPLVLLALAAAVEARPALLQDHGSQLRPALAACLEAVPDPGLKRRWAKLLCGGPA